jgi:hypothetical protein
MRQGRDKADTLAGFLQPHIAGGAAGAVGQVLQGEPLLQPRPQVFQAPILVDALRLAHIAHRHDLDKGQIMAFARAPLGHREQLVLVEAFQRHGVDFHLHASGGGGLDAFQHLRQAAPAGDLGEFRRVQRIDRDVDPFHPAIGQFGRVFRKLAAVGGQRQLFQRTGVQMPRHRAEEGHDAFPHQRLSAGDPQLFDAKADKGGTQPVEFFQRQKFGLGQEGHVFGHAIAATEVAAVGDRNAQVGNRAGEGIYQGRCHRGKVGMRRGKGKAESGSCRGWGGRLSS